MKSDLYMANIVKGLSVSEATMEQAAKLVTDADIKDGDACTRLYREWVNDTVVVEGRRPPRFKRDRDAQFLEWLTLRVREPYHVTFRAHEAVRASSGDNVALLFSEVRWSQEVAWASRMRGSDNDRIAVLAETWLTAARRDPSKLFRGLVDIYVEEALADPAYIGSVFHELTVDQIIEHGDQSHWRPLWLRFAEREFGRRLNAMKRGQLESLAARFRDNEALARASTRRTRQVEVLRARRPSLMIAVLTAAAERGLSSDALVDAEAAFIDAVQAGEFDHQSRIRDASWRIFLDRLAAWSGPRPKLDQSEADRRITLIEELPPSWPATLPQPFRDIGSHEQDTLVSWLQAIRRGFRAAPKDPVVDYGLWLAEGIRL